MLVLYAAMPAPGNQLVGCRRGAAPYAPDAPPKDKDTCTLPGRHGLIPRRALACVPCQLRPHEIASRHVATLSTKPVSLKSQVASPKTRFDVLFFARAFVRQCGALCRVRHNPSVEARPNGICLAPTRRSATFSASRAQAKYRWPRLTSNVRPHETYIPSPVTSGQLRRLWANATGAAA